MVFNFVLFLYFIAIAPKLLIDRLKGKKHPGFLQRLGFSPLPDPQGKPVIWIHSVSVGETKAGQPLLRALKKEYPRFFFLVTSTTATGLAEAKRSLADADAICFAPLDFTWTVRRWVKRFRPKLYLLIESDFWPNLLAAVRKSGGKTLLASGKLSLRSAKRFAAFPALSRRLFSRIDSLCVQNEEYANRFSPFVDPSYPKNDAFSRLQITGNLKLDIQPQTPDLTFWTASVAEPIVTLSCTHAPEEEWILDALRGLDLFFFLAPRHPERFEEVAELLRKRNISFVRFSQFRQSDEKVVLVDAMGQLPACYALSRLAIVAGSFTPKVGGHNVFEPCLYQVPVLFGPYVHTQTEFANRVLEAGAGLRAPIERLRETVVEFFRDSEKEKAMRASAARLVAVSRGSVERTLAPIRSLLH